MSSKVNTTKPFCISIKQEDIKQDHNKESPRIWAHEGVISKCLNNRFPNLLGICHTTMMTVIEIENGTHKVVGNFNFSKDLCEWIGKAIHYRCYGGHLPCSISIIFYPDTKNANVFEWGTPFLYSEEKLQDEQEEKEKEDREGLCRCNVFTSESNDGFSVFVSAVPETHDNAEICLKKNEYGNWYLDDKTFWGGLG